MGYVGEPTLIDSRDLKLGQVPMEDAGVEAVCRFAHTIDGYNVAGSFEDCARIADDPDPGSLDDLRISLFFRFRALRHTGEEESPGDLLFFRETIRRIRGLLAVFMPLLFCLGAWTDAAATDPVSSPTATQEEVGAQTLPSVALPPELDRVLRDYESAWQGKDPAGLAALFTEDGFVLSSGRPPVRGREAIADRYRNSGGPLALRALAFDTEGTTGYIIGAYGRAKGEPDAGKFTLVLRRVEGRWLIVSDMDNGNQR